MAKYIIKRVLYMVLVFLILSFLMYSLYNLIPGDPVRDELEPRRTEMTPEEYDKAYALLRAQRGLDSPLLLRYCRWLGVATQPTITNDLALSTGAGELTLFYGDKEGFSKDTAKRYVIPEGSSSKVFMFSSETQAVMEYTDADGKTVQWEYRFDKDTSVTVSREGSTLRFESKRFKGLFQGYIGYSHRYKRNINEIIGDPFKNTIFMNIFSITLALGITIPLGIRCAVRKGSKFDGGVQVATIVGYSIPVFIIAIVFIWVFAVILGIFPVSGMKTPGSNYTGMQAVLDKLYYLCLPLITMTFCALGGMTRYVRAAMIDALSMDYIRTARAKGLREKVVIYSHAWRNALLPVITLIIGWFLTIFSGSVIIEQTFGYNGLGKLYIDSLNGQDYEVVLALQMFYVVISLVGNLITDLSYGLVDPRVRVTK